MFLQFLQHCVIKPAWKRAHFIMLMQTDLYTVARAERNQT